LNSESGQIDRHGKTMGMWLFLFTEVLFFGGMFLLYAIYRYEYERDFHAGAAEESLLLGTINTVILLTSSYTIALAIAAVKRGERLRSSRLQFATILMGVVFIAVKVVEWNAKIALGLYPDSPALLKLGKGEILYFGLYYMMTGLHGLHVLIGCVVIAFMLRWTLAGRIDRGKEARLENTGLYWHFVDIVWIYLYPLFYLIT
jgi:cytochrome c oxidase subunit III